LWKYFVEIFNAKFNILNYARDYRAIKSTKKSKFNSRSFYAGCPLRIPFTAIKIKRKLFRDEILIVFHSSDVNVFCFSQLEWHANKNDELREVNLNRRKKINPKIRQLILRMTFKNVGCKLCVNNNRETMEKIKNSRWVQILRAFGKLSVVS